MEFFQDDASLSEMARVALAHTNFFDSAIDNATDIKKTWKLIQHIPYSPLFSYEANLVAHPTRAENIQCITGSPRAILHHATLASNKRHAMEKEITRVAKKGFYTIGIGIKEQLHMGLNRNDIHGIALIGIALFEYELHNNIQALLQTLKEENIFLHVLSNEHLHTCKALMKLSGLHVLDELCTTGNSLQTMSDDELASILPTTILFAELHPIDHIRIARLLGKKYEVITTIKDLEARIHNGAHAR